MCEGATNRTRCLNSEKKKSEITSRAFKHHLHSHLVLEKHAVVDAGGWTVAAALLCQEPEGTPGEVGGEAEHGDGACNVARGEEEEEDAWKDGIQPSVATPPLYELHFLPPPVKQRKKWNISAETTL